MRLRIDTTACIKCGVCTEIEGNIFRVDSKSRIVVPGGELENSADAFSLSLVKTAQSECPMSAIQLV